MKNTAKPMMLISAGIPLIQGLIKKNPLRKFTDSKIKFKCVHKIAGRRRYRSELLKEEKFAKAIKEKIDEMMKALNEQSKKLSETKERTARNTKNTNNKKGQMAKRAAMGATAAFAGGKGASAIGRGIGRGMGIKGGGATSLLPTLLSSVNLTGLSGIVTGQPKASF